MLIDFNKNIPIYFLSPHADDAIWSCGGAINYLAKLGFEVFVITIFDAIENCKVSKEQIWRYKFVNKKRIKENVNAISMVNAKNISLALPEAMIRVNGNGQYKYPNYLSLFRKLHHEEKSLSYCVKDLLQQIIDPCGVIISPLAIGGHVDHQITKSAIELIPISNLYYYADFPYHIKNLSASYFADLMSECIHVDVTTWIKASLCYKTQINALFQSKNNFVNSLNKLINYNDNADPVHHLYYKKGLYD